MSYTASLALNDDWDLAVSQTDSGLFTLTPTCGHRVNYQIVRTALIAENLGREIENSAWIDWYSFLLPNAPYQILAQKILLLLSTFEHISAIDLSGAEYNINNQTLSITGICFTSDCEMSKLECEVNL